MLFTIRRATVSDIHKIVSLHVRSWRENYTKSLSAEFLASDVVETNRKQTWTERLSKENSEQYVALAEHGENFAGFVCIYHNKRADLGTLVDNLHVEPDFRRKNVGLELMKASADWLLERESTCPIYLEVYAENKRAQQFYRNLSGRFTTEKPFTVKAVDGGETLSYHVTWENPQALLSGINQYLQKKKLKTSTDALLLRTSSSSIRANADHQEPSETNKVDGVSNKL